jgi:hypothetical protein
LVSVLRRVKRLVRAIDAGVGHALRQVRRPAVLFEAWNGFGFDAQLPVIAELIANGRVRPRVVAVGLHHGLFDDAVLAMRLREYGLDPAIIVSVAAARRHRFDMIIVTDEPVVWNWRHPPVAYLHHGSSYANLPELYALQFVQRGAVNYLFCVAEGEVEYCVRQLGEAVRPWLIVTGQPKIDALVHGSYDRAAYLSGLGLDPARKTVLVASHWRPESLFRSGDLRPLRDALLVGDVNVIVTAHHLLFATERVDWSGGIDWLSRLQRLFNGPRMRVLARVQDNRPMLAAADVLIGDHSSLHLEYATLQRPMIIYWARSYGSPDPVMDALLRATADVVDTTAPIPALLDQALANPVIDAAPRRRMLKRALDYVGESAKRVAEVIENI